MVKIYTEGRISINDTSKHYKQLWQEKRGLETTTNKLAATNCLISSQHLSNAHGMRLSGTIR